MRGRWTTIPILLAGVLLMGACGDDGPGAAPSSVAPVVVDTDLAVDDLVALTFLLTSDDVDVRAITVSGTGEVRCPQGLDVLRGLLVVTADEEVPIACGRTTPLEGTREFPAEWRDAADAGWGAQLPAVDAPASETTAVDLLASSLSGGGVTLLTLGPLTNVAEAFRAHPELADAIASLVVMGGAVDVPGNAPVDSSGSPAAEWNIYVDPTAAAEAFAAAPPAALVALDATNQVPITVDFLELMRVNARTGPALFVQHLIEGNPMVATGDAYFWDPLAAAAVVEPGVVVAEPATVTVGVEANGDIGRTMRDPHGIDMSLATGADADAFEQLLLRTLNRLRADEQLEPMPAPVADVEVHYDGTACSYLGPSSVQAGRMRLMVTSSVDGWSGGLAHLTGELTIDEILAWLAAHQPLTEPIPGIDSGVGVPAGQTVYADVLPDQVAVYCAPPDPNAVPIVAGLITVTA